MTVYYLALTVLFVLFVSAEALFLRGFIARQREKESALSSKVDALGKKQASLDRQIDSFEKEMVDHFFLYDLAGRLAPVIDKRELFNIFAEGIRFLGPSDIVSFGEQHPIEGALRFALDRDSGELLQIKTSSEKIIRYLPYLTKLLKLCIERIGLYEKLHQLSIYDSLTGVYNRRYFSLRYLEEFNRASEYGLNLAFVMIDLDKFKEINDIYGHLVGDAVLRRIADLIQEIIREIDFVARYGGEEFALILPETDKAGAIMVAERIRKHVSRRKIRAFDEAVSVTISAGVAAFPQNTIHSELLLETADKALYKAKSSGRNKVCWF